MQESQGQTMAQLEQAPDERMREQMHKAVLEAAERVTFHRVELERWERLGFAAGEAISRLDACAPIAQQSPEDFYRVDSPDKVAAYR